MKILLILANIIFLVIGQTFWKYGSTKLEMSNTLTGIISMICSPWIIMGGVFFVLGTFIWIYLLSKYPLSLLYPLQSLAYVFGLIIAAVIFHEHISLTRWMGVFIILVGVYFVAK